MRRGPLALMALACAGCGGHGPARPGRDGGTATLLMATAPPSLDPSLANSTEGAEALWVTNLPLLTYRHAEGEAGTQLIPALAQGLPAVSADGRTYMLVLRRGLRYSDGRPVRASDFTRAIERAIRLGSGYTSFFTTTIAGSAAFAARQARAISGIRTDDTSGRIVIHLVHPYGAFANLLAFPAAAPLPPGTPLRALPQAPPAGVGPYTLADIVPGHGFTLRRNRGFAGLHLPGIPTGHLTTVKVHVVANPAAETEEVLQNRADVLDASDAVAPGLLAQVRDKRGRFALTPEQETMYFFMDTRSRPFDSLAARQAVEYAVDRRALQRLASGFLTPSCYFVPPAVPGHAVAPCPYGLRPDLSRARRLLRASGRAGASVTVWGRATSPFAEFARYYAGVLASIGLKPTLRLLTDSVYYPTIGSAGTHAQTGYAEWVQDFPDPSDFYALLDARSIQPRNNLNLSRVDDPTIQRALLSLEAQTTVDARAWAALERHTAQQAYLVVIGQRSLPKFFSDRIDFRTAIISPVFLEDVSSWQLTDAAR